MPNIAVDAGPLIALFRKSDRYHTAAISFIERTEGAALISNLFVIGEVAAILGGRHTDVAAFLAWAIENVEIDDGTVADLPKSIEIVRKYKDLPADLADASLVALCERRGIDLVASLHRDFDVYRLPKRKSFRNVFFAAL